MDNSLSEVMKNNKLGFLFRNSIELAQIMTVIFQN